jgi:exodeoxyribonuclease VII small subunit
VASDESPTGYAEAVAELGRILAALDDERLDVDVLGDHVARAAELIAVCRARIAAARLRVDQIVADLDRVEDETGPTGAGPARRGDLDDVDVDDPDDEDDPLELDLS